MGLRSYCAYLRQKKEPSHEKVFAFCPCRRRSRVLCAHRYGLLCQSRSGPQRWNCRVSVSVLRSYQSRSGTQDWNCRVSVSVLRSYQSRSGTLDWNCRVSVSVLRSYQSRSGTQDWSCIVSGPFLRSHQPRPGAQDWNCIVTAWKLNNSPCDWRLKAGKIELARWNEPVGS
jgi:hypothetical protein